MRHLILLIAAASLAAQSISITGASATGHAARATQPVTLVATGATAPVRWVQMSGEPLYFSAPTSTTTSVTPPAAGTYTVRIVAANGTADLQFGAVATASNGAVKWSDPNIAKMFGAAMRLGGSPYTEFHQDLYEKLWTKFQGADWNGADWNSSIGTATVTNGSTSITGASFDMQAEFCNGAGRTTKISGQEARNWPVIWHDSGKGRRMMQIVGCPTSSTGTLVSTWNGLSGTYTISRALCSGCWVGGSDNVNYYDVVLGMYRLYYRTGNALWRDRARVLADKWNRGPGWDEGRVLYFGSPGPLRPAPRALALAGLMWWAYETGNSTWWVDNTSGLNSLKTDLDNDRNLKTDTREAAYRLGFIAVAAAMHPNSVERAAYATSVANAITGLWVPRTTGDVPPPVLYAGYATWNGYAGTVSATIGSPTIIGSGTSFTVIDTFGINQVPSGKGGFWIASASDGSSGDARAYRIDSIQSNTELTLTENYAGPISVSGRPWQANTITGTAWQPWQLGLAADMMRWVYEFTGNATARQMVIDFATHVVTTGWQPSVRGLRFSAGGPDCEASTVEGVSNCLYKSAVTNPWGIWDSRFTNLEATAACSAAVSYGATAITAACEDLFSAAFACSSGQPGYDGNCAEQLVESVAPLADPTPKTGGFSCGVGNCGGWPATRAGGYAADPRSVVIAAGTGATVDVRYPDGSVIATTCTAGACTANYDAAQGVPLVRITRGGIPGAWQ